MDHSHALVHAHCTHTHTRTHSYSVLVYTEEAGAAEAKAEKKKKKKKGDIDGLLAALEEPEPAPAPAAEPAGERGGVGVCAFVCGGGLTILGTLLCLVLSPVPCSVALPPGPRRPAAPAAPLRPRNQDLTRANYLRCTGKKGKAKAAKEDDAELDALLAELDAPKAAEGGGKKKKKGKGKGRWGRLSAGGMPRDGVEVGVRLLGCRLMCCSAGTAGCS